MAKMTLNKLADLYAEGDFVQVGAQFDLLTYGSPYMHKKADRIIEIMRTNPEIWRTFCELARAMYALDSDERNSLLDSAPARTRRVWPLLLAKAATQRNTGH